MNDINELRQRYEETQAAERAARDEWQRAFRAWLDADDAANQAWRAYWAALEDEP